MSIFIEEIFRAIPENWRKVTHCSCKLREGHRNKDGLPDQEMTGIENKLDLRMGTFTGITGKSNKYSENKSLVIMLFKGERVFINGSDQDRGT